MTRLARHQPKLAGLTGLGSQALGRPLLAEHKRQRIKRHSVLQKHSPAGCDRKIMQEGKTLEAVATVSHQIAGAHTIWLVCAGKFHQANGAGGARLDTEGDHAGLAVVTWIEAGVGAESFSWLEQTLQPREPPRLEGAGIKGVGLGRFPERQQLVTQLHHMGVGDVLEPQIEGIGEGPSRLLSAEDPPVNEATGLLLCQPALGAHKAVGESGVPPFKPEGADHAVAIKWVMNPLATPLEPAWPIAEQSALELSRDRATHGL